MPAWGHYCIPIPTGWYGWRGRLCGHFVGKGRRCRQPAEYVIGYEYVTGKAGRTTRARRARCAVHAEPFAKKHGLEFPPEVSE